MRRFLAGLRLSESDLRLGGKIEFAVAAEVVALEFSGCFRGVVGHPRRTGARPAVGLSTTGFAGQWEV